MDKTNYISLIRLKMVKEKTLFYETEKLDTPEKIAEVAMQHIEGAVRECLIVISLDNQLYPLAIEIVSVGTVNTTVAVPREIFKHAVLSNAVGIILVHNHPSGCLSPSQEDITFTRKVKHAGALLGIDVYDHIIIGSDERCYFSFRENENRR